MSRYDWGQTHPGITRLEKAVDEARTRASVPGPAADLVCATWGFIDAAPVQMLAAIDAAG